MKEYNGKKFANAETTIDYKKKKISFKYNNKRYNKRNENLAFFANNYYIILSMILWLMLSTLIIIQMDKYEDAEINYAIYLIYLQISGIIACPIIMGYTSIIVHKLSKTARKNFPETNAIIHKLKNEWKEKDLKEWKQKYFNGGIIIDNKIYLYDYNIISFEYKYIGENKITKIETKSTEPKNHKGEHMNYIAIIHFEKKIRDGILKWR